MITAMPRIAIATRDFSTCVATFRDRLGMPVIDLSEETVGSLGAKLAICVPEGGSNIELMSPATPDAPLSQSLQRFLDRRGEGLFALMLEAPDPDAEAELLASRGLDVLPLMPGAGGRDVHPHSTHGVLIRVYPVDSLQGLAPGSAEVPSSSGLSGIARAMVVVRDLELATTVYGSRFGLEVAEPQVDAKRGIRSAICTPPSGGVIELISVVDRNHPFAAPVAGFLEDGREGLYALVLQSPDLADTASKLAARKLEVTHPPGAADVLEIDRGATFGARIWIEPT
ncbi:MAG: VOC family protein [Deltaproteobacteria bacterium]|nr:VOC family protein [Deltaproteobacteria bacterium]